MRRLNLIFLFIIVANLSHAQHSGWLVPKDHVRLITYYGRYNSDSFRDADGRKSDFADDGKFSSDYFKISGEYGLSDYINLYAFLPFIYNSKTSTVENNYQFALGDAELGMNANLKEWERTYLMGSLNLGIPLYSKNTIPSIGLGEYSAGASLQYCGSIDNAYKFFFSIQQGVRLYFDGTVWWNNFASLGYNLTKRHTFIGEISGTKSFGNGTFDASPNANRTDFFYEKIGLGYYFRATDHIQIGGTIWRDIINRDSSVGKGFSAIAIFTF